MIEDKEVVKKLSEKIVDSVIRNINSNIIRSGTSEFRECYEIANELNDFKNELIHIVICEILIELSD